MNKKRNKKKSTKKGTLTKANLSLALYNKVGYGKQYCEGVVEDFFDIIKNHLKKKREVKIHGFGKFVVKSKKARKGRNIKTGKPIMISARKVLLFRTSQLLKDQLDKK